MVPPVAVLMSATMFRRCCFSLGVWKKTPQSTSMWTGFGSFGNVRRKQSPSPTRYIRTRTALVGFLAVLLLLAGFFGEVFLAGIARSSDWPVEESERFTARVGQRIGEIRRAKRCSRISHQELTL